MSECKHFAASYQTATHAWYCMDCGVILDPDHAPPIRRATTPGECRHDKVERDELPHHGWFCDNCNAVFVPESIGPSAATKLIDTLCNLTGVGPEKLAEKIAEWRSNLAELTERLGRKDAECAAAIDAIRGAQTSAMKIHNARLAETREALRIQTEMRHQEIDYWAARAHEQASKIAESGGVTV